MTLEKKLRGILAENVEFPKKISSIYRFGKGEEYLGNIKLKITSRWWEMYPKYN